MKLLGSRIYLQIMGLIMEFQIFIFFSQIMFAHCRYTLGGFFLANYDDSPAGVFDEVSYSHFELMLMIH